MFIDGKRDCRLMSLASKTFVMTDKLALSVLNLVLVFENRFLNIMRYSRAFSDSGWLEDQIKLRMSYSGRF